MFEGLLVFLVLYLFWRINQYERHLDRTDKKLRRSIKIFLSQLPEEKRNEILQQEGMKNIWEGESL